MKQLDPVQIVLINKMPPLHLVASGPLDTLKFISFRDGFAVATNGLVISVVPMTPLFDDSLHPILEGKYINATGWKYLYDHVKGGFLQCIFLEDKIVVTLDEDHTHTIALFDDVTLAELRLPDLNDAKFPNWQGLWNNAALAANNPEIFEHWVLLKPSLLELVAKVMGGPSNGVRIRPTGEGQPILISSSDTDWGDMYALIMPLQKNQYEFEFTKVKPYNPTL